jgi:hypothetical protein
MDRYVARYGYSHPLSGIVNEAIHTLAIWSGSEGKRIVDAHFNREHAYGEGVTWVDLARRSPPIAKVEVADVSEEEGEGEAVLE